MVSSLNSVTTRTTGWERKCWEWAEAGHPFELRDVETRHFMFCQEICAEYDYTYLYRYQNDESVAQFKPAG